MIQLTFYSGLPQSMRLRHVRNQNNWENALGKEFGGFTKGQGVGYWDGKREESVVYTIVLSEAILGWQSMARMHKLKLQEALDQIEVLVTWQKLGGLL